MCGALHAALLLHDDEDGKRLMHENFAGRAGSETCRESPGFMMVLVKT